MADISVTRRKVQIALGVLWLLDGILQLQPFMFGPGFARDILAPTGAGQPGWVSAPVNFFAGHIAQHPVVLNAGAATLQLALGLAFLVRRAVRPAVVVSIGWSIGVWWFGEGLSGLASGHASIVTGAPGAALLYGVLAAACWPHRRIAPSTDRALAVGWLRVSWSAVWLSAAALQALSATNRPGPLAAQIRDGATGAPGWLRALDLSAAGVVSRAGGSGQAALVVVLAAVGVGVLFRGPIRTVAALSGAALAALFWVVGQNFGEIYSGQATDPSTGVLLIGFAAAVAGTAPALGSTRTSHPFRRTQRHYAPTPRSAAHSGRPVPVRP